MTYRGGFSSIAGSTPLEASERPDFYQALRVRPDASPDEIDEAYRERIHGLRQERHQQLSFLEEARDPLALVEEAYSTLSHKERRSAYDRQLLDEPPRGLPVARKTADAPPPARGGRAKASKRHNIYEDFFGFSEKPFDLTPDPKYLYLSPKHKEVLAHLIYGLQENNGFLKIAGEVGTGKTMISRCFLNQLTKGFNVAYIFNPCLDSVELLQSINNELGINSASASRKELTDILNAYLLEERKKGNRVVIIIDEAQNLDPRVLEQLRLLSNLETETQKLIQIVLIGQPELNKLLDRADLRQLRQRITIQWELLPLNQEETQGYIQHRLNVALGRGKVRFTSGAMAAIYRYSEGIPRMINVLADRSLLIAYTMNTKKITARIVRLAARDIGGFPAPAGRGRKALRAILPAAALLALLFFAINNIVIPDIGLIKETGPDIKRFIQENPLPVSEAPKPAPPDAIEKAALPQAAAPAPAPAAGDEPAPAAAPAAKGGALEITHVDKLVTYLASLSLAESKVEAAKWILKSWGLLPSNLTGLDQSLFEHLDSDFQFKTYDSSASLKRLQTLNYPAILELTLPDAQGTKYLALISTAGSTGTFGSVDKIQMPLSILDSLWNQKAIILWRDFEGLPPKIDKGFNGKEALWIQKNLRLLGHFNGPEAPSYGQKTVAAVTKFQRQHGIKDDGNFNTETRLMLYSLLDIYATPKLVPAP